MVLNHFLTKDEAQLEPHNIKLLTKTKSCTINQKKHCYMAKSYNNNNKGKLPTILLLQM